jgi:hypothetical protein
MCVWEGRYEVDCLELDPCFVVLYAFSSKIQVPYLEINLLKLAELSLGGRHLLGVQCD